MKVTVLKLFNRLNAFIVYPATAAFKRFVVMIKMELKETEVPLAWRTFVLPPASGGGPDKSVASLISKHPRTAETAAAISCIAA
jgi:hypothetical protein